MESLSRFLNWTQKRALSELQASHERELSSLQEQLEAEQGSLERLVSELDEARKVGATQDRLSIAVSETTEGLKNQVREIMLL